MQNFPYQDRARALETAFGLYLEGAWPMSYVSALYYAELSDTTGKAPRSNG
jgi:hypothetical protein